MRVVTLILLFFICSFAEDLTLIGLSGSKYKIPYNSDYGVDAVKLFKSLFFASMSSGDTLRVKNAGHSVLLTTKDTLSKLDGKVQNYPVKLQKVDNRFWLSTKNLPKLLNSVSTYSFSFEEASLELSVHHKSSVKVAETKKPTVTAPTVSSPTTTKKGTSKPNKPTSPKVNGGVVVIDPGHGGKDPGAVGPTTVYEKTIALAIARKTAKYIRDNSNLTVYLTRDDDTFIPLRERTTFANSRNADLFVSIHCNAAAKNDSAGGYKIYFLSDAKNATDERIAVFENAVMDLEDDGGESDLLQSVLKDMINNEYLKESQELSADIERSFRASLTSIKPHYTGVGQANFYVLNGAQMPSVLVETAFISNKTEEKLLRDEAFQTKMAQALGKSIISFRKKQGK